MLRTRIITAVILVAILLPALLAQAVWPFALLTLVMIAAGGWEWGRLNGLAGAGAVGLGGVTGLLCLAAWQAGWAGGAPAGFWWAVLVCWVVGAPAALRRGPPGWLGWAQGMRLALGVVILVAGWLALAAAKATGLNFILSVFCLVWAADIAAYFGGRAFGRRKLAPSISPGKSWEGVWSGMVGVVVLALLWLALQQGIFGNDTSIYGVLQARWGTLGMIVGLLLLCGLSVVGDLLESLIKRAVGAKDSSRLLPGHGGVLDRVDALLPVFPAVMALATL